MMKLLKMKIIFIGQTLNLKKYTCKFAFFTILPITEVKILSHH